MFLAVNLFDSMTSSLAVLFIVLGIMVILSVVVTFLLFKKNPFPLLLAVAIYLTTLLVLILYVLCMLRYRSLNTPAPVPSTTTAATTQAVTTQETTIPTEPETTAETTEPDPTFTPEMVTDSDPANWNVEWEVWSEGEIVENFQRTEAISFGTGDEYYPLPGIASFRGNNYRDGGSYGTVNIQNNTLTQIWSKGIGSLDGWPGVGWTGQPTCVQWDQQTKDVMDLYDSKKAKADLVEVICTTLDGNIYFYDLEDGTYTRDPIYLGQSVKGSATLDPRGWPILYVGSGLVYNGYPQMYVISLVDNTILYEQNGKDPFAKRSWYAFDSSPMVSGETDTLIWPGESGVLYSIKLNTNYDPAAGTLTMAPETIAKARYTSSQNRTLGYEASVVIAGQYAYLGDNGGMFFCVDLNTMGLVWARDIRDDLNASPIFQWEDGKGYLYVTTSMEYADGSAYVYKLDAATGETIWEYAFTGIRYDKDVSGGSLSTPILGKAGTTLEGMLIVSVSKTHGYEGGTLAALDTKTGELIWENKTPSYAWSSPVAIYSDTGAGYFILGDSSGDMKLYDSTGKDLAEIDLRANIEASPMVFNDMIVVGTRDCKIFGIKIG